MSSLSEANGAAAVSAAIASAFPSHGQVFQAPSAQAAAFHSQFVQAGQVPIRERYDGVNTRSDAPAVSVLPAKFRTG